MAQPLRSLEKSSFRRDGMIALMDQLTLSALAGHNLHTSLQGDIDLLHAHGWLFACAPQAAGGIGLSYQGASLDLAVDFLFQLGCANLALGRLFEGHVNACKLVYMLASPDQAKAVWDRVAKGAFLGVWGADGRNPVTLNSLGGTIYLNGEKTFCSGLGSVSLAIVSAKSAAGLQLILAQVTDEARGDASQWQSSGMQATRSGTYDFDNLPASHFTCLGAPNAYYLEPHFLGGQWRYLALHAGCVGAIAQAVSAHLNALNRAPSETELMRLARIVALSKQARLWAMSIAQDTEITGNAAASIQAVLGREQVESACLEAMALAERTVGTRACTLGTRLEQLCRDLRTYVRQAALDQRLLEAGKKLLALSPTGQSFLENCGAMSLFPDCA